MDAKQIEGVRPTAGMDRVAELWARVAQRATEQIAAMPAEQSGRPEAAAKAGVDAESSTAAGADPSNTHPQNSQVAVQGFPNYRASSGIDWWEIRSAVGFDAEQFSNAMTVLESAKLQCQELHVNEQWLKLPGHSAVLIYRTGMGGSREHFEYRADCGGVTVGIGRRQGEQEGQPNLLVRMSGRECLLKGAIEGQAEVEQFVSLLGGHVLWRKLSRVDLCLDVANLPVRVFEESIRGRQFITRSKSVIVFENAASEKWTGFAVGKQPLRLIVYDKLHEQAKSVDDLYFQALIQRRYGGSLPDCATRIEFQMSRAKLKEWGVSSPEDFLERRATIIEALMANWFRITAGEVDRESNHQSRAETHPLWESLRRAFIECVGQSDKPLIPIDRTKINPQRLIRQGLGCLRNAALQCGIACHRFEDLAEVVAQLAELAYANHLARKRFIKDFIYREKEFAA